MNQGDGYMKFSNGWFWSWKCGFVTFFSYLYYFSGATFEDFLPGGVRSYQEHVGAHARRGRPSCRCEHGCICWCECSQTASAYLCWRTEVHTFVISFSFFSFSKGFHSYFVGNSVCIGGSHSTRVRRQYKQIARRHHHAGIEIAAYFFRYLLHGQSFACMCLDAEQRRWRHALLARLDAGAPRAVCALDRAAGRLSASRRGICSGRAYCSRAPPLESNPKEVRHCDR